ncbi:MAG: 3'-5' exonuclease, partial [Opitutales bacterium]
MPKTEKYRLGFDDANDTEVEVELLARFDALRQAWLDGREEYLDFVREAGKGLVSKHLDHHLSLLDDSLSESGVSPAGLRFLDERLRETVFAGKYVRAACKELELPRICRVAERFCQVMGRFGRAIRVSCARFADEKIEGWKATRALRSFDDLLGMTERAVSDEGPGGAALRKTLGKRFEAALIDEFQDTDPVQFRIFRKLFGGEASHWLFLIGDPKQSIYRFRGADLEAYFSFAKETGARKYSLTRNYRAVTPLVHAVNSFFELSDEPFLHKELPFAEVKSNEGGSVDLEKTFSWGSDSTPPMEIREMKSIGGTNPSHPGMRRAILRDMGDEIERLLAEGALGGGRVRSKDIAILVRSNNQAREVWRYLRRRRLPAIVFSDVSLFEGEEAKELSWIMEAIVDSRNERSIKRALATGLMGKTAKDFETWQDVPEEWEDWVGRFRGYLATWREKGVYVALRHLFLDSQALQINLRRPDGERRVTNFLHLAETLHQASSENPLSPASLNLWLRGRIADEDRSSEEYQLRLESESEAIQILTTHKSKGLEYPIVFLPFLFFNPGAAGSEFRYHDKNGELVIDLNGFAGDAAKAQGRLEEEQEDARVLYVALTRAASRCYLYHGRRKAKSDEKEPALTRCIRSWSEDREAGDASAEEEVDIERCVAVWLSKIEDSLASYQSFSPSGSTVGSIHAVAELAAEDEIELRCEEWRKGSSLPGGRLVTSFSGLTKKTEFDGKDLDADSEEDAPVYPDAVEDETPAIFQFPAGAHAGNFMHHLFEEIDFTDSSGWGDWIDRKLVQHGYPVDRWRETIRGMLDEVIGAELLPGLRLADVASKDRRNELDFHFSLQASILPEFAALLPEGDLLRRYLDGARGNENEGPVIQSERFMNG